MTAPTPPQGTPAPPEGDPVPFLPPVPPFSITPQQQYPPLYPQPGDVTAPIPLGTPQHAAPKNRALALAFTALIVSLLSLTAALFAWGTAHPVNPQGPQGPAGPQGATGPRGHNHVSLCIVQNPATGDVASITVPVHGACGPDALLIQVP